MSVKVFAGLLDRFITAIRSQACTLCNQIPVSDRDKLICHLCEQRLLMRQSSPMLSLNTSQIYVACEFPNYLKQLIYRFKFHNQQEYANSLAEIAIHYWNKVQKNDHKPWVVVPIPGHTGKETNHLTPIFQLFASEFGYQYVTDGLRWNRSVSPQHVIFNKRQRRINVSGALEVTPEFKELLRSGTRILVVDDIVTSGITLIEALSAFERTGRYLDLQGYAIAHVPFAASRQRPQPDTQS